MISYNNDSKAELVVEPEFLNSYEKLNNIKWYDRILLNSPLKLTIVFLLIVIAAPLLLYHFYFFTALNLPPSDGFSIGSCLTPRESRLPCGVGQMPREECHPQCCYDLNMHVCFHRIPSRFSYIIDEPEWSEGVVLRPRIDTVPFSYQNSTPQLRLSIDEESATHMIVTLYNAQNMSMFGKRLTENSEERQYSYEVGTPEMNISVKAKQGTIFKTVGGPLIASENIWEIAFQLTNETMYGLGEIPLKINMTKVIYSHSNDMSSIPLIFARMNTSFHGLLIDISEPTEVLIHPSNQIIVRSITNSGLKFHLFVGPEPNGIMQDVMKIVGRHKQLQYWMLGTHVCSEVPDLDLDTFISDVRRSSLPMDSHCGHAPILFNSDQCRTSNLSNIEIVNSAANIVRLAGLKFVPHVSPYIRYFEEPINDTLTEEDNSTAARVSTEGCRIIPTYENIMYRRPNTREIYRGEVNDIEVIYPSYKEAPEDFLNDLWAYDRFDGMVLENSWPLDTFQKEMNETSAYLPYFSESFQNAFANTPQWNLTLLNDSQLYMFKHNTYGNSFAEAFFNRTNSTPFYSTSLWMNGNFPINRQNIDASWTNLHRELIAAALGGISGNWLWSSPVCGDTENFNLTAQSNLCVKWYLASTYFPLIKIHSSQFLRYPTAFKGTERNIMIGALQRRLGLLPFFYTTLQEGPLLRPMFYQFPSSKFLHDITTQFSVGEVLLIVPNLTPMQSHVHMWLPPGTWYEAWSGLKIEGKEGDPVTMATTEADFLTFIRGGTILCYQKTAQAQAEGTRLTPFSLIVALECNAYNKTTTKCHASGKQFISDDLMLIFKVNDTELTITSIGDDFEPMCDWTSGIWGIDIDFVDIYGLPEEMNNFDNRRQYDRFIDLCDLEIDDEIVVDLLS